MSALAALGSYGGSSSSDDDDEPAPPPESSTDDTRRTDTRPTRSGSPASRSADQCGPSTEPRVRLYTRARASRGPGLSLYGVHLPTGNVTMEMEHRGPSARHDGSYDGS